MSSTSRPSPETVQQHVDALREKPCCPGTFMAASVSVFSVAVIFKMDHRLQMHCRQICVTEDNTVFEGKFYFIEMLEASEIKILLPKLMTEKC